MVGDVGLDTSDAHEFPALVRRVSPRLASPLFTNREAFRALALAASGVVSQKLVVHHLPPPRLV